eukprot:16442963-Heterocapsa_arctica.AAC.1
MACVSTARLQHALREPLSGRAYHASALRVAQLRLQPPEGRLKLTRNRTSKSKSKAKIEIENPNCR